MRKTSAIILIAILLFNWYGYSWVSAWLQQKADKQMEARLDNKEYDESTLFEMRVPLHLPYMNDWNDFERYDGQIVLGGILYKYVKRKVQDGMLILKCIPNETKQQLISARDEYFKRVNDLQQNSNGSKKQGKPNASFSKNLTSEFDDSNYFDLVIAGLPVSTAFSPFSSPRYSTMFHYVPEHPPKS